MTLRRAFLLHRRESRSRSFSIAPPPRSCCCSTRPASQRLASLASVDADAHASLPKEHGYGCARFLGFRIREMMYGKCGTLGGAAARFSEMQRRRRDVCAWNHMIGHRKGADSLASFDRMLQEGVLADAITYIAAISACATQQPSSLAEGRKMHARIAGAGYESHVVIVTALVSMYGKCGDARLAAELFDGMPRRDTVTWNAWISGFKQRKRAGEALQHFHRMEMEGVLASRATFACVLSGPGSIRGAGRMHARALAARLESEFVVANALVRMYARCGGLGEAQRLFDALSNANVVASNAMLSAYARHGRLKEALELLGKAQLEGAASVDAATYMSMLDACGGHGALSEGREIHACIKRSGLGSDVVLANALITMYGRCRSTADASEAFDEMPEKDVVSWNAIISACSNARDARARGLAFALLDRMKQSGMMPNGVTHVCVLESIASQAEAVAADASSRLHLPLLLLRAPGGAGPSGVMVGTALINVHARAGSPGKRSDDVFDLISEPNVVAWTAMISAAHSLDQHGGKPLQLFARMLMQGTAPDMVAYLNAIVSCTSSIALNEGKLMHARLRGCGLATELPVANALINMYAKCGEWAVGWGVFEEMPARNVASWNVMAAACAQHGLGARCLLARMVAEGGAAPDKVTFVTYLSACSHIGSLDEAIHALSRVAFDDPALVPTLELYDCVVDMLGRAGLLQEAHLVIGFMPHQPSALSWMTLLTTCRSLLDPRRGEASLSHIREVDPRDHVPYVMLANIYAALGRSEDASTMLASVMMAHAFPDDNGCHRLENADLIDG